MLVVILISTDHWLCNNIQIILKFQTQQQIKFCFCKCGILSHIKIMVTVITISPLNDMLV